jgi:hypothetical protein
MEQGKTDGEKCPYCDGAMGKSGESMNSCSICGMDISGKKPHIIRVDEEIIYHYCGIRCMELHEESIANEDGGEPE